MKSGRIRQVMGFSSAILILVVGAAVLGGPAAAVGGEKSAKQSTKQKTKQKVKELPPHWYVWLEEEVYPLITPEQRRAFVALETEAQRKAFVERLWVLWGRQSGIGTAFRGIYEERLLIARTEFGNTIEDRARILLIHGPPAFQHMVNCDAIFQPMVFWGWPYIEGLGEDVVVLFFRRDGLDRWRMWTTLDGMGVLYVFGAQSQLSRSIRPGGRLDSPAFRCPNGDVTMRLLAAARAWSNDPKTLKAMNHILTGERAGPESTAVRFMAFSALLDDDAEPLGFSVSGHSKGGRGGLVEVGFAIDVDSAELGTTEVGDIDVVQLDVIGEITRNEIMVDRFRYLFSVPQAEDRLGLLLDRLIRPGAYHLRLKVEDVHSNRAGVLEYDFTAEPVEEEDEDEELLIDALAGTLVAAVEDEVLAEEDPEEQPLIRLVGPQGDAVSGLRRFEAVTREEVARVTFLLDNESILTKNRPPFDVDLNLGPLPRLTAVTAIAYDASGNEIARDGYTLNVGRERFFVRLEPMSPANVPGSSVRVAVEVNIPSDGELDRIELYWNDQLLETLHEPPFEAMVQLDTSEQFGYLRALAILTNDAQAEDLRFVNSPQFGSVVQVTVVELPVTVLDKSGSPVEDLALEDFKILEDGVEQTISHFSMHRDMPVRLGIVIDTSGSMATTLPTVQRVVMGFLRNLLRPRDRAFIETFSDRPDMLAGFTANFEIIENALLALYADRATAFYDAIIVGLFQFSGVSGRRAMVVLSDGDDTASKNEFSDALGYARRMGVTIFAIGVDLPASKITTRWQLNKLASVTGGKAFFVTEKSGLGRIYSQIDRELRTQYLLAFTSNSERPSDKLRKIKVEVARKGVKVRTITGYYPAGSG
ncbi:MAG: VWA domain-containing protein [Thermoanaerobaculales bacterium]